ncbi:TPA: conjugal transfer protein [Listeria monocytogenes]|uniref:conjugal transfer protein n=1 Tax=Listeria seeligeri TaxID=1640 RepID=UPI0016267EB9|nr:conjugal transfer protein [Listeria seeligeri]HAO6496202.1 conjugal transfer protein [Listeria monocytogenes]MBC1736609.1 conjugal transfer protein [Listeria seeligeri]MBF2453178.1 conjugal transfer protein [Listeria seeligeri]MBF2523967.1 conjugal transfer protein [Listeria seeligeri]HDU3262482.1 conjugal transfer protein [Listeria monocytogenes]
MEDNYRKIKSYTGIWNVEMVLHAIGDLKLPFAVTGSQIVWFVVLMLIMITLNDVPPFNLTQSVLFKDIAIPFALTWFVSKKTFDGKKPYSFLLSIISYYARRKVTTKQRAVKLNQRFIIEEEIPIIRTTRR